MSKSGAVNSGAEADGWVAVAHILRPQGRKGEVLADLLTDQLSQFRPNRQVRLLKSTQSDACPLETRLESHWLPTGKNAGRIVLKLQGVRSISEAEPLSGADVMIPSADLAMLEAGTFYVKDLLGCTVQNGEHVLGKVVDVQFVTSADGKVRLQDAAPLLAVDMGGGEPVLVPLVRSYLETVNLSARNIAMKLPAGLIEAQQKSGPLDAAEQ